MKNCGESCIAVVENLRCEYRTDPLGIDALHPRLSWQTSSSGRGEGQSAYRVLVASSLANLAKEQGDLWDSGLVPSDQSVHVRYAGKPLTARQSCHWKVLVYDKEGRALTWSEPASWTMGLLAQEDWTAQWISTEGVMSSDQSESVDTTYVRRSFTLPSCPDSAIVTVNVMGFFELYVNGTQVGSDVMSPDLSDYHKRSLYLTYNLKPYLRKGKNCIGLWTSRGWYWKVLSGRSNPAVQHDTAIARVQLDLIIDGQPLRIGTDEAWRCKASGRSILGSWSWNEMGGELVDARLEDNKWADPEIDEATWHPVTIISAPAIQADAQKGPPMRVLKTLPAIACVEQKDSNQNTSVSHAGKTVEVDFGTNLTGWLKLRLRGLTSGQEITIQYADAKDPYQTFNQKDRFISAGHPEEEFCSKFNYHGFRWILIEGLSETPLLQDAEALAIGADWECAGSFECSNARFNRMHEVNLWTLICLSQSGFLSDCPHRERLGYGDGQVSIESCIMNFRMAPFYNKWATDWCDGADSETGYLPHAAPQYKLGGGGPAWGGTAQALIVRTFLHYGDKQIVERNYEACRRHIEAIEAHAQNDIVRAFGGKWDFLGDWVPPGRGMDTDNWPPVLAAEFFNNCYRLYLREQLATMADALGRHDEAQACRAELQRLRPRIHAAFYDEAKQIYVLDEQSYQIMPLMTGVVPESLYETILKKLETGIRVKNKGHLDTGMLGTYFLLQYLSEIGRNDLVFDVVNQAEYPGWGYMLEQGATTWWEQWNGFYSRIHSCFTSLDGWFYQGLAGIQPDPGAPGFKKIVIKPAIVGGNELTWVSATHDSPYGRIESTWKREEQHVFLHVVVPFNTTATIHVPARYATEICEGGHKADKSPGVILLRREPSVAVFEVGSGIYDFLSELP